MTDALRQQQQGLCLHDRPMTVACPECDAMARTVVTDEAHDPDCADPRCVRPACLTRWADLARQADAMKLCE